MIIETPSFSKSVHPHVHENAKPAFPNSSGLERFFEKFRFCDGLALTVGQLNIHKKKRSKKEKAVCFISVNFYVLFVF